MWNAGLDEAQAGIKIAGRNTNNLRYADADITLMAESKGEVKNFWMKVKEESEKVSLKLNIQKTKIMASSPINSVQFSLSVVFDSVWPHRRQPSPITSWQTDGETVETVSDFILGGSKITADGDWSREIKRCLLLERKAMTNLDSI